jgi:acyl-coenzyme A thioesterase PaaI-like protein
MPDHKPHVDEAEVKSFVSALPFVQEFSITITSVVPGQVTIELPFNERFSGPPGQFPASIVGVAGDVAAVASCLSLLPNGWALATLDFTIKMTGAAKGNKLRAKGACYRLGAQILLVRPTCLSFRSIEKPCVVRCWRRRETSRS